MKLIFSTIADLTVLFLNKNLLKKYNFETAGIYIKINAAYSNVIKLAAILKHFSDKNITKVA